MARRALTEPGCSVTPAPSERKRCARAVAAGCYGAILAAARGIRLPREMPRFPMTSCLVLASFGPSAPQLDTDLEGAGIHVLGAVQRSNLVQDAVRLGPDIVVCHQTAVDEGLFEAIGLLQSSAPRPVLLFTPDPDADKMTRALEAGVHCYVVNGYGPQRRRALVHLAQARF